MAIFKSSHQGTREKSVLKNFTIFTGKHFVLESLFNKLPDPQGCKFIKKRLQYRCFPVIIEKFLRTFILQNIWKWLFLNIVNGITFFNLYLVNIPNVPILHPLKTPETNKNHCPKNEEILNGKLQFLSSECQSNNVLMLQKFNLLTWKSYDVINFTNWYHFQKYVCISWIYDFIKSF